MPRASDGVADGNEYSSEDHEAWKFDTLCDRSGNDGRRCCCEHGLEDEVTVARHGESQAAVCPSLAIGIIEVTDRSTDAEVAVEVTRVMGVKTDERVG